MGNKWIPSKIIDNKLCTGCGSCINICPVDALAYGSDADGYIKPSFDINKCISCHACERACPLCVDLSARKIEYKQKCFAAWAPYEIRKRSSSGGAFQMFSRYVLENGGTVFGAAYTKSFDCVHIETDDIEKLQKISKSKYVQSNPGYTFRRVKELLKQNKLVLYSGTPCQIDGLRSFLGYSHFDNLICVDIFCSHVPPLSLFKKYLDESYGLNNLVSIEFRAKECVPWDEMGMRVTLKDGKIKEFPWETDDWGEAFSRHYMRNAVCANCKYHGYKRVGDISIGDFWSIELYDKSWNDEMGTSILSVNNIKGEEFLKKIKFDRLEELPIEMLEYNGGIVVQDSGDTVNQERFMKMVKNRSFQDSIRSMKKGKHDIGLVCMANHNIGNNFTNYALYQFIVDCGYSVLFISAPKDTFFWTGRYCTNGSSRFELFKHNPYPAQDIAPIYNDKYEMLSLNDECDSFVVGSDLLWEDKHIFELGYYVLLDFVKDSKYKFAYAPSFFNNVFNGDDNMKQKTEFLLKRFQKIAVREKSGVNILKDTFDIDGDAVLDPVFLCNVKHYKEMAKMGLDRMPKEQYIGAYIIYPSSEMDRVITDVSAKEEMAYCVMLDAQPYWNGVYDGKLETLQYPYNEEWLAMILNCELLITDSFHGMCFAIIFNRPFYVIKNEMLMKWGWDRCDNILKLLGLEDRACYESEIPLISLNNEINWDTVNSKLKVEVDRCSSWLIDALKDQSKYCHNNSGYDALFYELEELRHGTISADKRVRSHLFLHSIEDVRLQNCLEEEDGEVQVVAWGTGKCFKEKIGLIRAVYNLKYVCDNNPLMWGKEVANGVICISPKQLKEMNQGGGSVVVIIMVYSSNSMLEIIKQLISLGIGKFDSVDNWLKAIKGDI